MKDRLCNIKTWVETVKLNIQVQSTFKENKKSLIKVNKSFLWLTAKPFLLPKSSQSSRVATFEVNSNPKIKLLMTGANEKDTVGFASFGVFILMINWDAIPINGTKSGMLSMYQSVELNM